LDLGRELPHLIAVVKDQAYIGKRIVEVAVWEMVGMPEQGSVPGCEVVAWAVDDMFAVVAGIAGEVRRETVRVVTV
jgi:hypothetical protein